MAYLVIFRGAILHGVLELPAEPSRLGWAGAVDFTLPGSAPGPGVLTLSPFGRSLEVRADAGLPLEVNGVRCSRKLLEAGDRLGLGELTLLFSPADIVRHTPAMDDGPHRKILEALFRLGRDSLLAQGGGDLLERTIDGLLALLDAERGFILSGGLGESRVAVHRKLDPLRTDHFSHTVVNRVLTSGQPIVVSDTHTEQDLVRQKSVSLEQIRSVVAVPLLRGKVATGVIYLDSRAKMRIFGRADVELLQAAADHVVLALENWEEKQSLKKKAVQLREVVEQEVSREHVVHNLIGRSLAMRRVLEAVRKVAQQDTSTLILGESGTGKELIARAIHALSSRGSGPFVAVNCTALSASLLESELFGHERGAFTGASDRRIGRFELADGGTLFLDEIGELDPPGQVKLLRVLQERVIERVGGNVAVSINVRLICATNADMKKAVATGRFRDDLYYRIAVFPILVPPLRERRDDVPLLAAHFVSLLGSRMGRTFTGISREALEALCEYAWPGNVRELRNLIERAMVLEGSSMLSSASFPAELSAGPGIRAALEEPAVRGTTLAPMRRTLERQHILDCMRRHGNNISVVAEELAVPRSTVYRKLRAWGALPPRRRRTPSGGSV